MKTKLIIIVFLGFLYSNCRKEFVIDQVLLPEKLVVNCLFSPDTVFNIHVCKLQNTNDNGNQSLTNANVTLFEDNVFFETLLYNSVSETYISTKKAQNGKTYKLTVKVEGFPEVVAIDKVPGYISIDSANVYISAYYDSWEDRELEKVNLFFINPSEENYFEVISYTQDNYDSISFFELPYGITSIDPVITAEGILDYTKYLPTLVFCDNLLDEHAEINFMPFLQLGTRPESSRPDTYTVLRNISKNYYLFQKKWYLHIYNNGLIDMNGIEDFSDMSFVPNPIQLYSNIENGLGIFASYTESIKLMIVK